MTTLPITALAESLVVRTMGTCLEAEPPQGLRPPGAEKADAPHRATLQRFALSLF